MAPRLARQVARRHSRGVVPARVPRARRRHRGRPGRRLSPVVSDLRSRAHRRLLGAGRHLAFGGRGTPGEAPRVGTPHYPRPPDRECRGLRSVPPRARADAPRKPGGLPPRGRGLRARRRARAQVRAGVGGALRGLVLVRQHARARRRGAGLQAARGRRSRAGGRVRPRARRCLRGSRVRPLFGAAMVGSDGRSAAGAHAQPGQRRCAPDLRPLGPPPARPGGRGAGGAPPRGGYRPSPADQLDKPRRDVPAARRAREGARRWRGGWSWRRTRRSRLIYSSRRSCSRDGPKMPSRFSRRAHRPCGACSTRRSCTTRSATHRRHSALDALIAGYAETAAYQIAEAYAWRGDRERAFEWLERPTCKKMVGSSTWEQTRSSAACAAIRAARRSCAG